jgi:hypothetical protein
MELIPLIQDKGKAVVDFLPLAASTKSILRVSMSGYSEEGTGLNAAVSAHIRRAAQNFCQ